MIGSIDTILQFSGGGVDLKLIVVRKHIYVTFVGSISPKASISRNAIVTSEVGST